MEFKEKDFKTIIPPYEAFLLMKEKKSNWRFWKENF